MYALDLQVRSVPASWLPAGEVRGRAGKVSKVIHGLRA